MTLPFASTDTRLLLKERTLWGPLSEQAAPTPPRLLSDKFAHLDMTGYRTSMPAQAYVFFVGFAGAETIGFTEGDFEDFDSADDF